MQATELGSIDLGFRPQSYFWPLGLETHLLSRIKGAERKAALKMLVDSERLEDIPDFLAQFKLSEDERGGLGRIHPAFMGGEYLPDLMSNEVMIARITIASTTQDVTCVYARGGRSRINYRVVDEYGGDTLSGKNERTSNLPLTLDELETFFSGAWSILEVLDMNFGENGYDEGDMQRFVVGIDSEFYPGLEKLYRARISEMAAEHHVDEEEDDGVEEGEDGAIDTFERDFAGEAAALEAIIANTTSGWPVPTGYIGHMAQASRRRHLGRQAIKFFLDRQRLPSEQELVSGCSTSRGTPWPAVRAPLEGLALRSLCADSIVLRVVLQLAKAQLFHERRNVDSKPPA
jgi:hypothetical protein